MRIKNIRKGLGLLIVDIAIIIGIFLLQFRTDSRILEKLGLLQITLEKAENKEVPDSNNQEIIDSETSEGPVFEENTEETVEEPEVVYLQNKLHAEYNGLSISVDNQSPARIQYLSEEDSEPLPVMLETYKKFDDLTYEFDFEKDIKLFIGLSSEEEDAVLTFKADLPKNTLFYLPYSYDFNSSILKEESSRIVLDYKQVSWEIEAYSVEQNNIVFKPEFSIAMYNVYEDVKKFTFDSVLDLAIAEKNAYETNVASCKTALISSFNGITVDANTPEQYVVSYIAAMGEKGEYVHAVDNVSSVYKKSPVRTYLSAPYLNTLDEKNTLLDAAIAEKISLIDRAATASGLDVYTTKNLASYLCISRNTQNVALVLRNAANYDYTQASLAQTVGVMQTYLDLLALNVDYSVILKPAMEKCLVRITDACNLNGEVLTISENDTFLSVLQAVDIGVTLMRYGLSAGDSVLEKAGYAIINSYMAEASAFDLRTLASLYPIIAYDNWYYPHFEKISINASETVWAWTCAKSIKLERTATDEITYTIDFPETYIHYVIMKGIPRFKTIYIYNMAFRTDPRFETYNSSGYVYKRDTETLLLKSRHKTRFETVRIELADTTPASSTTSTNSTASSSTTVKPATTSSSSAVPSSSSETKPAVSTTSTATVNTTSAAPVTTPAPATPAAPAAPAVTTTAPATPAAQ